MFDESDYERASQLAQSEIDAVLDRHRAQQEAQGESRATCLECGELIPVARQKAVSAQLCIECQAAKERQMKLMRLR